MRVPRSSRGVPPESPEPKVPGLSPQDVSAAASILRATFGGQYVGGGMDYCHREAEIDGKGFSISVLYDRSQECNVSIEALHRTSLEEIIQGLTHLVTVRDALMKMGFSMNLTHSSDAPWEANFVKAVPLGSLRDTLQRISALL